MGEKFIVGTLLCFVILLVLPTIPAMKLRTIQRGIENSTICQSEAILVQRVNDFVRKGDLPTHPLLFFVVEMMFIFRYYRGGFLMNKSVVYDDAEFTVKLPLLYLRGFWLVLTAIFWYMSWATTSEIMGWGWDWPDPFSTVAG
jgi:hypothetical protein